MKNIILGFTIVATTLAACNSGDNKTTEVKQNDIHTDTSIATDPQVIQDTTGTKTTAAFSTKEIIAGYLQLKNALAKDNGKNAATAGKSIVAILEKVNKESLSAEQMKAYTDLQDDIKEHAEHIGANADKIEHQREHFEMLSKDIVDLIKAFGNGGQTLYKDFCPMYNDGKGAVWISEVKEIKNPYLGSKMLTCGSVKETIK